MAKTKKLEWTVMPPVMSWDRPIEDIILEYVRSMASSWRVQQHANIWGHVRKDAESIVMAYESVEKYIVKEKEFRAKIAEGRKQRKSTLKAK